MKTKAENFVIVALDAMTAAEAIEIASQLKGKVWGFKVNDLFVSEGPAIIERLSEYGNVFYDPKFFDIKNTVANYAKKAATIKGVKIFNVHALGGIDMMKEAVKNKGHCKVFAVTILTDKTNEECQKLYGMPLKEKIIQLARDAKEAGVDGIICSAEDLEFINKEADLKNLKKIVAGIRPRWAAKNDQERITTPGDAVKAGVYRMVIGRPVTKPPSEIGGSMQAAEKIAEEIRAALAEMQALIEKRALEIFAQNKAIITGSHIVYASGRHGSEYVNKDAVYPDTEAADELCEFIAEHFQDDEIEVVVAPVEGGITLSHEIAGDLTKLTGHKTLGVYADKEEGTLVFKRGYDKFVKGKRVLVADDVLTTGGSVAKLVQLVRSLGGEVVAVAVLCNRGGIKAEDIGNVPELFALSNVQMESYEEKDCPLCKVSVPINTEVGKGKEYLAEKSSHDPAAGHATSET